MMSDNEQKIRAFSNGTEYHNWIYHNCEQGCARYDPESAELPVDDPRCCPIEAALCGGDDISMEIWERMGKKTGRCTEYTTMIRKYHCPATLDMFEDS